MIYVFCFSSQHTHALSQLEELEDKELKLRKVSDQKEKTTKVQHLTQEKAKKNVDKMRKQLTHERSLKLDAFQRVDELQTQVRILWCK